jgi:hypothetical protein
MAQPQWARLREDAQFRIRRGAWYRVLKTSAQEVVLEVNRRPVTVPREALEIRSGPPQVWAVVPRPRRSDRFPDSWGEVYGVCPNCRARAPLLGKPSKLRCEKCNGVFEVGWPPVKAAS